MNSIAQLKLPSIIDDNMIIQRDKQNTIWGWATPGEKLKIQFMIKEYTATANKNGEWKVILDAIKGGQGGNLIISTSTEKKIIKDVLAGEVWLCSGQSNMEYPMSAYKTMYAKEIEKAEDRSLRYMIVQNSYHNVEVTDAKIAARWVGINSTTVEHCSAVAYFFAKKLREKLDVPVGLIISTWSGTPAQAWMDTTTLKDFSNYMQLYNNSIKKIDFSNLEAIKKAADETYKKKQKEASRSFWPMTTTAYNDDDWEKTKLPKSWELIGHPGFDGVAAYRISFTVPETWENKPAVLHLPAIDDIDSTYINGIFIGSKNIWNELRVYNVPVNVLKAGRNVITIWVEDTGGGGGLNADADNYFIQIADQKISLKGDAAFKILAPIEDIAAGVNFASLKDQPGVLFNAMIAPLLHYNMSGVIWYQGESNVPQYAEYRTLFPSLINCWRRRFDEKSLPFLFVQLSSYNPDITEPTESDWALLRESQTYALRLPFTGMAVSTDVGDQVDLHPKRKKEVGERLAANAFNIVYGFKDEVPAGPLYSSAVVVGNAIKISYTNIGKGLMQKGDSLLGFKIAGADRNFIEATAIIRGNDVLVSNPSVTKPIYVRYAWANAPLDANLYNKDGFPAAPFRTDK